MSIFAEAHLRFLEFMDLVELVLEHLSELALILVGPIAGGCPRLEEWQ